MMQTQAIVFDQPGQLSLRTLDLCPMGDADVLIEIDFTGISTGTERLLFTGRMPPFPGLGYPLVPGYESVGRIVAAGRDVEARIGERVFVPGASCYRDARGLFGGAARSLIAPATRALPIAESLVETGVLIALAATAQHALAGGATADLIIGHGVLGRLLARLSVAAGGAPVVWETNARRCGGADGYSVINPADDDRRDYRSIYDVSGDPAILDQAIARLAKGGEVVLAGFYDQPLSFAFAPAFLREARIRIASEWQPADLSSVQALIGSGALSLAGLVTNRMAATSAESAYPTAFGDADCLKMILDWRGIA